MSIADLLVAIVLVTVAVALVGVRGGPAHLARVALGLRWASLAAAVAAAVALLPFVDADSPGQPGAVSLVLGLPVACSAVGLLAGGRLYGAVLWVVAAVSLGWAVITGLGLGLGLVPSALLLLAAAAVQTRARRAARAAAQDAREDLPAVVPTG